MKRYRLPPDPTDAAAVVPSRPKVALREGSSFLLSQYPLPNLGATADRAVAALNKELASEKIDVQDGIRSDWGHARPSNMEPIMRIIAEAPDRQSADEFVT